MVKGGVKGGKVLGHCFWASRKVDDKRTAADTGNCTAEHSSGRNGKAGRT